MQLPPDIQRCWDFAPQGNDSWTYEEIIGMLDQTTEDDTIRHAEETPTLMPSSEKSKASQPIAPTKKRRRLVPSINLSQLIDKKKLFEGERVKYIRKKEKRVLKEGFVRHQGIECCCCGQIYSMSKLEEHAGIVSHRASQHIYLESGKSLANCQSELAQEANTQMESDLRLAQVSPMQSFSEVNLQILQEESGVEYCEAHLQIRQAESGVEFCSGADVADPKVQHAGTGVVESYSFAGCPSERTKYHNASLTSNISMGNVEMCYICRHNDSGLLACGGKCMRRFHMSCIGLEVFPENIWFCPYCVCELCGGGISCAEREQFGEKTIFCGQCEFGYHLDCLRQKGFQRPECSEHGYWFCGEHCSKIFIELQYLLGKDNPTGVDGLFWTLMKSNGESDKYHGPHFLGSTDWKLDVVHLLQESFLHLVRPNSWTQVINDIVFSKELKSFHQNYRGFYTMILHRGRKPISVAIFRVRGSEMAEVPLMCTQVNDRRKGMCHLLHNNLTKLLSDLGVGRVLLSVSPKWVPNVMNSYGFLEIMAYDRFLLLAYPYMEFPGTVTCQKLLHADMNSTEFAGKGEDAQDGLPTEDRQMDYWLTMYLNNTLQ